MGRLRLLDDWVTWSLPQLFRALAIPHFFCASKTLLNEADSAVEISTNGDGMKFFPLVALFAMTSLAFAQDKCLDLCSSCMNGDSTPACTKVEKLCKCNAMLEGLQQELATSNTTPIDSVAPAVPDSVDADTMPADQAALDTNARQVDSLAKVDSSGQNDSTVVVTTPQDTQVVENTTAAVVAEKEKVEEKKDRIFYFGLSLGFEQFQEVSVANYDVEESEEIYDHLGANLGFFLRWYFYRAGSFQLGLNAVYHHGYYDIEESDYRIGGNRYYYNHDVSINYHSIMAEIPLTFRLGIPFVLSPYLSLDIHVRKPIYAWIDYDVDVSMRLGDYYEYSNRDYDYDDYGTSDGAFADSDWEFLGYLGFGIEFTRHVSIQWQMLLIDAVTYSSEVINYELLVDTWRINLDIAF